MSAPSSSFRTRSALVIALSCGAFAGGDAVAQTVGRHVLDVDTNASAFNFSGRVTIIGISAPIVGQPANFNVSGQASADLGVDLSGVSTGQLVAGNGTVVTIPTLNARVPNPIPIFPDLATIQVTGATAVFFSVNAGGQPASFPVAGNGSFGATIGGELLSGVATISGQINQTIQLGGQTTTPQSVTGTLVSTPSGLRLQVGISTTVLFSDPTTGASGTLNLGGTIVADDQMFASAEQSISLASGGTQVMRLSAGSANGSRGYAILATGSGTSPGLTLNGVNIPVNFDGFTTLPLQNMFPYTNSIGVLDARGLGTATYTLPPLPVALNLQLHHAYAVLNGATVIGASNPIPLQITP